MFFYAAGLVNTRRSGIRPEIGALRLAILAKRRKLPTKYFSKIT